MMGNYWYMTGHYKGYWDYWDANGVDCGITRNDMGILEGEGGLLEGEGELLGD